MTKLSFHIPGQIRGGKNNIIVLKNGRRIPNAAFSRFVRHAVAVLEAQKIENKDINFPLTKDIEVHVIYTPEDNRRRDVPSILDGLWHVFERAGIVDDDRWLGKSFLSFTGNEANKTGAGAFIKLSQKGL